jgi:hypothetical protein
LDGGVFDVLLRRFDCRFECFASPFDCRYAAFCSPFPDTDAAFGSLGSFFTVPFTEGVYQAHLPPVTSLASAAATRIESLLEAAAKPLFFIVFLAVQESTKVH